MKLEIHNNSIRLYYGNHGIKDRVEHTIRSFNPLSKKLHWIPPTKEVTHRLYTKHDSIKRYFEFNLGMVFFINYAFKDQLDSNSQEVLRSIKCDPIPILPNLYDYQNSDLQILTRYKLGLFQVRTKYGKTEMLATLADYYLRNTNKIILFMTSSNAALTELRNRMKERFGIVVHPKYDPTSQINVINIAGYLTTDEYKNDKMRLSNNQIIMFDEVEKCMTSTVCDLLDNVLINRERLYGFSATTNKVSTDRLSPNNPGYLDPRNFNLIRYFGYSLVFRLPDKETDELVVTKYNLKLKIPFKFNYLDNNSRFVIEKVYTTDQFSYGLGRVLRTLEGCTFIPINSRVSIDYWIERMYPEFRIIYLSGSGYWYYNKSSEHTSISLNETKELILEGKVDVFFSTRSGYNSLDIDGIHNVVPLMMETSPDNIVQGVGRSREYVTNIVTIKFGNMIPIYDSKMRGHINVIKNHYKNSNIINKEINL